MANSKGVFSALGGDIVVSVEIVPEPEIIESQLLEVMHNLENTTKPMLAAKRVAQEDVQAHFDTESDPDGYKWVELDADYLRSKESLGFPADILQRTGDMMRAATSDAAFVATPTGLFFNWDALPKDEDGNIYGQILQAGSADSSIFVKDQRKGHEGGTLRLSVGVGSGNALPARRFVDMSEDAEAAFWHIFDVWFDESVSVVVNPKTGIMQRLVEGGRFGRKVI